MKIAVPTRGNDVDDHFGHCEFYSIYTTEGKEIIEKIIYPSPIGCGCKSNVSFELQSMGVKVMLAGNMGEGAKSKLESCDIKVIRGCSGPVDEIVKSYLAGYIIDSGIQCQHHECNG